MTYYHKIPASNFSWPFGSAGSLLVRSGETLELPAGSVNDYSSVVVQSGGVLEISQSSGGWTIIGCAGDMLVNGTIKVTNGAHITGTFTANAPNTSGGLTAESLSYTINQSAGGLGGSGAEFPPTPVYAYNVPVTPNNGQLAGAPGFFRIANATSFHILQPTRITQAGIWLFNVGTPAGNVFSRIIKDSGGSPSTNPIDVVATSANFPVALIPAASTLINFGYSPNIILSPGTYYLTVETDATYKASWVNSVTYTTVSRDNTPTTSERLWNFDTFWSTTTFAMMADVEGAPLLGGGLAGFGNGGGGSGESTGLNASIGRAGDGGVNQEGNAGGFGALVYSSNGGAGPDSDSSHTGLAPDAGGGGGGSRGLHGSGIYINVKGNMTGSGLISAAGNNGGVGGVGGNSTNTAGVAGPFSAGGGGGGGAGGSGGMIVVRHKGTISGITFNVTSGVGGSGAAGGVSLSVGGANGEPGMSGFSGTAGSLDIQTYS